MDNDTRHDELANIALAAAKEAARQTLNETFAMFGVNLMNFENVQEFRNDLEFIRSIRKGATKAGGRFFLTIVTLGAGAVAIGAWEYIKTIFR